MSKLKKKKFDYNCPLTSILKTPNWALLQKINDFRYTLWIFLIHLNNMPSAHHFQDKLWWLKVIPTLLMMIRRNPVRKNFFVNTQKKIIQMQIFFLIKILYLRRLTVMNKWAWTISSFYLLSMYFHPLKKTQKVSDKINLAYQFMLGGKYERIKGWL